MARLVRRIDSLCISPPSVCFEWAPGDRDDNTCAWFWIEKRDMGILDRKAGYVENTRTELLKRRVDVTLAVVREDCHDRLARPQAFGQTDGGKDVGP